MADWPVSFHVDPLLTDDVAVVTGGASGIGRTISLRFAEEGADVVVADLQAEPREDGTPTHELIAEETDSQATFVECDVTSVSALEAAVAAADEFGGVTVMVNNAGIFRSESFLEVTEADYRTLMDVNVKGVFFGAQAAAKRMVEGDGGAIINMSSVAGLRGTGNYTTYCTSKGAVRLLTYALADELGPEGVRVNAIHPGLIETEMMKQAPEKVKEMALAEILLKRLGQPEEVANVVAFLASDLSRHVTGQVINVDGGQLL